jgi:hypothetical protein
LLAAFLAVRVRWLGTPGKRRLEIAQGKNEQPYPGLPEALDHIFAWYENELGTAQAVFTTSLQKCARVRCC